MVARENQKMTMIMATRRVLPLVISTAKEPMLSRTVQICDLDHQEVKMLN